MTFSEALPETEQSNPSEWSVIRGECTRADGGTKLIYKGLTMGSNQRSQRRTNPFRRGCGERQEFGTSAVVSQRGTPSDWWRDEWSVVTKEPTST